MKREGMLMRKNIKCSLVSYTYEDLKEERQKIVEAILDAGYILARMEIFDGINIKRA